MSDRRRVRPMPTTQAEALAAAWELIGVLEGRVADLEARTGALPGDYRYEETPAGILIRRVSTGGTAVVVPPL